MNYYNLKFLSKLSLFLVLIFFYLFLFIQPTLAGDLEVCQDAGYTEVGNCNGGYCINATGNSIECAGCIANPKTHVCCLKPQDPSNPPNPIQTMITGCIDYTIGNTLYGTTSTPDDAPKEPKPVIFTPQVSIPGSIQFGGKIFSINQGQDIQVNSELLAKYIAVLFNWLIGAIGVIVVAYMAFGGMQWLAAAGSADGINKAKETIRDSMIGLLLVVSSYSVLYFINPRLVGFNFLEVTRIGRIELIADGVEPEGGYPSGSLSSTGDKCDAEQEVISFPGGTSGLTVTASNRRLKPVTKDKLISAASIALNQGYTLEATSMFRTYAQQEYLYNCYQTKSCNGGNAAAKPDCKTAPHMNGIAVDVCIVTPEIDTCSYIKQMYNDGKNAGANSAKLAVAQKKLQEIMKQAGFNRFCGEWWHFEAVNWTSNICEPGVY